MAGLKRTWSWPSSPQVKKTPPGAKAPDRANDSTTVRPPGITERDKGPRISSRRRFLLDAGLFAAAATLLQASGAKKLAWLAAAEATTVDVVRDTFNALLAFVVPGPDEYSLAQGVSTEEPGGIEAAVTDILIETMDETAPFAPQFSALVAAILNQLAQAVNPNPAGTFPSHFARLSFPEKAAVIQIMDATDELKPLSGVLVAIAAFLVYSEAGVFDPDSRSLTGTPVGWELSSYQGVSDGRDEFRGYLDNLRKVQ